MTSAHHDPDDQDLSPAEETTRLSKRINPVLRALIAVGTALAALVVAALLTDLLS